MVGKIKIIFPKWWLNDGGWIPWVLEIHPKPSLTLTNTIPEPWETVDRPTLQGWVLWPPKILSGFCLKVTSPEESPGFTTIRRELDVGGFNPRKKTHMSENGHLFSIFLRVNTHKNIKERIKSIITYLAILRAGALCWDDEVLSDPNSKLRWTLTSNNRGVKGCTPLKTNMTLEHPHFQSEIHLQMVDFLASHVSFRGVNTNHPFPVPKYFQLRKSSLPWFASPRVSSEASLRLKFPSKKSHTNMFLHWYPIVNDGSAMAFWVFCRIPSAIFVCFLRLTPNELGATDNRLNFVYLSPHFVGKIGRLPCHKLVKIPPPNRSNHFHQAG